MKYSLLVVPSCLLLLGACASGERARERRQSELDIATVSGCDQPSMTFHELRDAQGGTIASAKLPLRVDPGVYTVGVECSWAHNPEHRCVDTRGAPELKVAPYDLILNPRKRYVFQCELEGREYVIRMSESHRR